MTAPKQKSLSDFLDEIESRANAATPSPWLYDGQSYAIGNVRHMLRADGVGMSQRDAVFIAAARNDVPTLVSSLRRALRYLEALKNNSRVHAGSASGTLRDIEELLREPADSVVDGNDAGAAPGNSK